MCLPVCVCFCFPSFFFVFFVSIPFSFSFSQVFVFAFVLFFNTSGFVFMCAHFLFSFLSLVPCFIYVVYFLFVIPFSSGPVFVFFFFLLCCSCVVSEQPPLLNTLSASRSCTRSDPPTRQVPAVCLFFATTTNVRLPPTPFNGLVPTARTAVRLFMLSLD